MESVPVAYRPTPFFTLAWELTAAGSFEPFEALFPDVAALFELLFRDPTTPPTTAPMMMRTRMGRPHLIHGLVPFFFSGVFPKAAVEPL